MRRAILCPIVGSRIVMSEIQFLETDCFITPKFLNIIKNNNSSFLGFLPFFVILFTQDLLKLNH